MDVLTAKFFDKINQMNIQKTKESGEEDDNHNEDSYAWHNRCKILDIQPLLEEIKNKIKEEKKMHQKFNLKRMKKT